jgi:hypothetical protein
MPKCEQPIDPTPGLGAHRARRVSYVAPMHAIRLSLLTKSLFVSNQPRLSGVDVNTLIHVFDYLTNIPRLPVMFFKN